MQQQTWQIIDRNTPYIDDSNWIEEEERLLQFAETPVFEKQPLDNIAFVFLYTDLENNVVGASRTTVVLDKREMLSILHRHEFMDKINTAKLPSKIFHPINYHNHWIEKQYVFGDAGIYCIPVDSNNISNYQPLTIFVPLQFSKDMAKISSALIPFHELYEILIIMREEKPSASNSYALTNSLRNCPIKSILKNGTTMGKTKKVRISDELPNEVVFSRLRPVAGKRHRTRKIHH